MGLGKIRRHLKAQTAEQAADHAPYYKSLTPTERLAIANYLNSVAYNYPEDNPPKLDRTVFSSRKRT